MKQCRASRGRAGNGSAEDEGNVAGRILSRLRAAGSTGIDLADAIDVTTDPADLLRWIEELRRAGWIVERFFDGRAPRYRVILSSVCNGGPHKHGAKGKGTRPRLGKQLGLWASAGGFGRDERQAGNGTDD